MADQNTQTGVVIRKDDIEQILAPPSLQGKNILSFPAHIVSKGKLPFSILEDTSINNAPELHKLEGDLWYCLEGEVTFVHGGVLVNKQMRLKPDGEPDENEFFGERVEDGEETILYPGDWLWIPPGVPHQHGSKDTARLAIIKIPKL